jgi:hypothetical protein
MELAHLSDVKRAECVRTSLQLQGQTPQRAAITCLYLTIKVIDGVETLSAASL